MNSLLVYLGPAFFLFNEMLFTDKKKKKKRRELEVADWKSNYRNGRIYFFITFDDLWILFELCQCNQNDIRLFYLLRSRSHFLFTVKCNGLSVLNMIGGIF
jgi:hypothetical protein